MFSSIVRAVKEVLRKMGLLEDVKGVRDIPQFCQTQTALINHWKAVYKGYCPDWHDVQYSTVNGGKKRRMSSMNAAKALCAELAGLTFNERCQINVSGAGVEEFISNVFAENRFFNQFQNLIEQCYALGGAAIKVWRENGKILFDYVTADCFIPLGWDNRLVTEGVFVSKFVKDKKYYTLLEWHYRDGEEYVVKNNLYRGENAENIGTCVALSEVYPNLQPETRIKGLKNSLFVYFKPNIANNLVDSSPLGVSVYGNALDTLRALDVCFDSFTREFILGKKRIIVPSTAVRTVPDLDGNMRRYFDANDEVYQALSFEDPAGLKITDNTVELRVDEHISAINAFLSILALQTGLTTGTLSFDGAAGVKTATEVISEQSKTFKTIKAHENVIADAVYLLIDITVELGQLYDLLPANAAYEKSVVFDDSIVQDKNADIAMSLQLVASGLRSKFTALVKDFGYTEEEAVKELRRIMEENKVVTGTTVDFFNAEV
jgi:A118 family predicted phage portal protein